MSAYSDNDATGPFDGPGGGPFGGHQAPGPGGRAGGPAFEMDDDYEFDDEPRRIGPDGGERRRGSRASSGSEGGGLELVGAALFLAGCLPAAAVAKALADKLNLAADGLGGTAALAAGVANWVGPWPALFTGLGIAIIGALIMLGLIRSEPLRYVGGALVTGLGLSAVASGLSKAPLPGRLGPGGQLGSGMEGTLTDWLGAGIGPWATLILGLVVIATALWLAFAQDGPRLDEDGLEVIVERNEAPRSSMGHAVAKAAGAAGAVGAAAVAAGTSVFRRPERSESDVLGKGADRQRRVSNKKVRRMGAPATLGDALARGGTDGVTHDEAAALAPDDKTLAYMEDVWRRAAGTVEQPEPIPPSPYPEDVRLKGEIPDGAMPLSARPPASGAEAEPKAPGAPLPAGPKPAPGPDDYQSIPKPVDPYTANPAASYDVAPFDFEDELSAPMPLNQAPPPAPLGSNPAADPFGAPAPAGGLSPEEAAAYEAAVLREGASAKGPSELPPGVTPFVPKAEETVEEAPAPSPSVSVEPVAEAPSGSILEAHPLPSAPNSISFERPEPPPASGQVPMQAMQAGAMPASFTPPPRPAWEQDYGDDDDPVEPGSQGDLDLQDEPDVIPDVDPKGRWQRRDGDDDLTGNSAVDDLGESDEPTALDSLEELVGKVDDLEWEEQPVGAEGLEGAVDVPDASAELDPAPVEVAPGSELEDEASIELVDAPDDEEDVEGELEDAEDAEEGDDTEEDEEDEEAAEYEEYEEDEEDDEEAAESDGEVEYEYVDEDGNPIDPEDLGEEYELVDEEDEEDEEAAEYEEYEEDDVESQAEHGDDDPEAEEAPDPPSAETEDVVLEPQAPPTATASDSAPAAVSSDGTQILEAGRLVVQKDRAAVSVIQKGFGVEFAEACAILEELHAEGLIGPYQEGKKRAILLSLEEWEGRFAHS